MLVCDCNNGDKYDICILNFLLRPLGPIRPVIEAEADDSKAGHFQVRLRYVT